MTLFTSLANIKRAIQKFVVSNVGKVLDWGVLNNVYWVKYTVVFGLKVVTCVTFISVKWLKYAFVELRKVGAQGVTFQKVSDTAYAVDSHNSMHFVHVENRHLDCTCPDFEQQVKEFGRGCCKHGYAVLRTLGYTDLRSFISG